MLWIRFPSGGILHPQLLFKERLKIVLGTSVADFDSEIGKGKPKKLSNIQNIGSTWMGGNIGLGLFLLPDPHNLTLLDLHPRKITPEFSLIPQDVTATLRTLYSGCWNRIGFEWRWGTSDERFRSRGVRAWSESAIGIGLCDSGVIKGGHIWEKPSWWGQVLNNLNFSWGTFSGSFFSK